MPEFTIAAIEGEYRRWQGLVGPADPYLSKYTIGLHETLQAHFLLADFFSVSGEGIGGVGPKNTTMLHSALARQFVEFGGRPKYTDRIDICASLMFGLINNHPFHDANKRTAFLVSLLHLQKVGRTPTVGQQEYEDFTVNIANHALDQYPWWGESRGLPGAEREVYVISRFLKRNSREIDRKLKTITYNELSAILSKRGMRLDNPNGNRIDLVRLVDVEGNALGKPKRIAHIGFHGWSREVSRKDIDIVREASRLDAKHGYDSQSFFNGLDGPLDLIKKYREPLERLAFR